MQRILSIIILSVVCGIYAMAADTTIVVKPGNSEVLMDALVRAREYKRRHSTADGYQFYVSNKDYPTVKILLKSGVYRLYEPLTLRPEDTNLVLEGEDGTTIVGSVSDEKDVMLPFRQLWVNGKKAVLARDVVDWEKMPRIRNYDKQRRILWLPRNAVPANLIDHHDGAEIVLHQMWEISILRIKDLITQGDSVGVTFLNPEARVQFSHPWPGPMYNSKHNSPFYFQNAKSLLDRSGEWWYDKKESRLHYMAKSGDSETNYEIPQLETLVRIVGTPERPVRNVTFRGIAFSYTTFTRPSYQGHVPLQAGMYLTEAYKLRPKMDRTDNHKLDNQGWLGRVTSAIDIYYGHEVNFSRCQFTHLGGSGLDYRKGCKGGETRDCTFSDIAYNGFVAGSFSPEGLETHLPYQPEDTREVCEGQRLCNNTFTDVGNEDWGCLAVAAGYVSNTLIEHNTIHDVPYSGINVGWGWNRTKNCMHDNIVRANLIYNYAQHVYDCAGVYTLGNQPGTIIEENVVRDIAKPSYVHDPNHWFYLYTDEGSSNITVRNNWTTAEKYLKNACGPGNVWENNGPKVSASIKERAGVVR